MTGRAASAVCMQTISTVWIQTIDHSYFPQTHTQTQLWHTPIPKHPPRQRHIKKKTTAFWRHACRRKVAGFQCHSLRSGKHSTGRTLLSEIKVCSFSSGNWMKTEVQNVLCLSGVVFCARQTPRSEQISHLWETQELLWILQPYFMKSDQFSEVVMNVYSEITWGIIRDNSCFLLKKRGGLHQDDFS